MVVEAVANAHSMLEETSVKNGKSKPKREKYVNVNYNIKMGAVNNTATSVTRGKCTGNNAHSSQGQSSTTQAPPNHAFSSWMFSSNEDMSSKAVNIAKGAISNSGKKPF